MIVPRIGRCQYCGQACAYCTGPDQQDVRTLEALLDEIADAGWKITSIERPYHGDWRVVLHDEDHTMTRVGGAPYTESLETALWHTWAEAPSPVSLGKLSNASQLSMALAALIPKAPSPPPLSRRRV